MPWYKTTLLLLYYSSQHMKQSYLFCYRLMVEKLQRHANAIEDSIV